MTPTSEALRRVLRRELSIRHGVAPADGTAAAAATVASYEELASHVARIIGSNAVDAIYGRSVQLTQKDFPSLSPASPADAIHASAQQLRTILEGQEPSTAALAAEALVMHFADLLVALIGEELTLRLFRDAWPDGFRTESRQGGTE